MIELIPVYMLRALLITLAAELAAARIFGVRGGKDLVIVALAQLVTNPPVVISSLVVNLVFGTAARNMSLAILEVCAFAAEGLIYISALDYKKTNPFLLSLALNAISFSAGGIINFFLYR